MSQETAYRQLHVHADIANSELDPYESLYIAYMQSRHARLIDSYTRERKICPRNILNFPTLHIFSKSAVCTEFLFITILKEVIEDKVLIVSELLNYW